MKRQSLVLLAVAFVAAGAAGCFKDPVSGLRGGPSILNVDHAAVNVRTGDSTSVTAQVMDNGGNVLPETDATWTSLDPTMAVVRKDTTQVIPGNYFTRSFIRGISTLGGWTRVIVTTRGLSDTIRVTVIPSKLDPSLRTFAGASLTDTVIVPASVLPVAPARYISYTALDTLVLTGTSVLTFDTSQVTVSVATTNGTSNGFIVYKTPSKLKVVFEVGTAGKVMVRHVLLTPGTGAIGSLAVDTLIGDSVAVAPWRIGPAAFGGGAAVASNILTVTAGTNMTFDTLTTVSLGGAAGIVIGQSATAISLLSPANYSGPVTVYGVNMAASGTGVTTIRFDSLSSNSGLLTLTAATYPAANINLGGGKLGDTITITPPSGLTFSTSGAVSRVILGNTAITTSDTAWNLTLTSGTIQAFAKRGGVGKVTVTNLKLASAGAIPFALTTPATMAIDSIATDFPAATSFATAHVVTFPANDTVIVYGAGNPAGRLNDYWTFTTTATQTIYAQISWFGNGNPYGTAAPSQPAYTPDYDLILCSVATQAGCNGAAESSDLMGFAAATASQPQQGSAAAQPAGQYWLDAMNFTGPYTAVYKLMIVLK